MIVFFPRGKPIEVGFIECIRWAGDPIPRHHGSEARSLQVNMFFGRINNSTDLMLGRFKDAYDRGHGKKACQ
jgi:hypothetical protein